MKTYTSLNESLTGRNQQRRKLANNTYAERRELGAIAIRLHQTDIVTFYPDGRIVANTGGWKTLTTKDRLNEYLPVRIWQKSGRWLLGSNGSTIEFADGLTIHPDGSISGGRAQSDVEAEKSLQKRIKAYCDGLAKVLPLPRPGAGDCFYCQMREVASGKPIGEVTHNTGHLCSHMEENYFVPSLVWNALEFAGCNPQGGGCAWFDVAFGDGRMLTGLGPNRIKSMVRKYLRRQFGLA
jgi:hypothetical protein